jgi:leucyl/phenylalanyl-tRNA--protein transferase
MSTVPIVTSDRVAWLSPTDPPDSFPHVDLALREPDGLLAAGGDLSTERLLVAYRTGIFPWYEEGQPILWWSPDPRCVLRPQEFHVSRRLHQYVRRSTLTLSCNRAFEKVIEACAGRRTSQQGTWITADVINAYKQLHADGWAHSVEVWDGEELVGGIYGLSIGRVFFGESMFNRQDNASKFAMLGLCSILAQNDFELLDCQVLSQHLLTLGARLITRSEFSQMLRGFCATDDHFANWPSKVIKIAELARN